MIETQMCFLTDNYYRDFPDDRLMRNKETASGTPHGRPCFLAFKDSRQPEISWVVPISSQVGKYRKIAQHQQERHGRCITIRFGKVFGKLRAFLIQNMCPATERYLTPYFDAAGHPVRVGGDVAADVERNARTTLALTLARRGARLIFPDVFKIYAALVEQLAKRPR